MAPTPALIPHTAAPHSAFKSLPLVDISGLFSASEADRVETAHVLGRAAAQAGFLYVTGHSRSSAASSSA